MGWASIAAIVAELAKLARMIFDHSNSPEMVKNKLDEIHQQLKDKNEELARVLSDPSATKEQKDAAFEKMKLADS